MTEMVLGLEDEVWVKIFPAVCHDELGKDESSWGRGIAKVCGHACRF
jgi:hypothetical protein